MVQTTSIIICTLSLYENHFAFTPYIIFCQKHLCGNVVSLYTPIPTLSKILFYSTLQVYRMTTKWHWTLQGQMHHINVLLGPPSHNSIHFNLFRSTTRHFHVTCHYVISACNIQNKYTWNKSCHWTTSNAPPNHLQHVHRARKNCF